MSVLAIENLTKTFQGPAELVAAVQGVSLTVDRGEFVAVVGPSGCGKTTLLLAAGALLRPTAGTVTIGGTNPYDLSPDARAKFRAETIGFVFQQFHLIPYLTVLENVLAPSVARPARGAMEKALALARKFNLVERKDHAPAALSTGERQRTALTRALLHAPALILADEPTGNLDRENSALILEHLADLAREGRAVLMATHDEYVKSVANRVVRLEKGKAVG
ncbi:MAG: ABC transporter ATP-binding protein [Verrucomicrobiota bacterium]|nr:ABC transporter ATP-binding protein [Verrucomicrobiota bacterium]